MNSYQLKQWLWKVIRSCETKEQIRVAENLVKNYEKNCNAHISEVEIMKMFLSNQEVFISVAQILIMTTTYTYYKNSNTGEILMKQHFSDTSFKRPDYFYDWNKKSIDTPDLNGFVEISEKTFNREAKLKRRSLNKI